MNCRKPLVAAVMGLSSLAYPLAAATFVQNPSFENNYNPAFPHYGTIDSWSTTGGSGVNEKAGPFHNTSTAIPDQARVGFLQGSGSLKQTITGLNPGTRYWIQYFYDARDCCGGTIDIKTQFASSSGTLLDLDKVANVKPARNGAPYGVRTVAFVADADSGELRLLTEAAGDASALFDGVSIVAREEGDLLVANPSFEASGLVPDIGTVSGGIAGWISQGVYGINQAGGAYADNGTPPDQDNVLFLNDESSVSQTLVGLIVGNDYEVRFAYNARSGNTPHLSVTAGETEIFSADVTAVGGVEAFRTASAKFKATSTEAALTFSQTTAGDQTLLLDDIRVLGVVKPPLPCLQVSPTSVEVAPGQSVIAKLIVPSDLLVDGPATLQVRTPNPGVASITGADENGVLTLVFDQKGATEKTFEIVGVSRGSVRMEFPNTAGLCLNDDLAADVVTSFVRNPSFESGGAFAFPGYGPVLAWEGGSGKNKKDGPFHDNGSIPDRDQIAFIQNSGRLAQQIVNLAPGKNYWLQFNYNARNCCGGTVNLSVKFDGKELISIPDIKPVVTGPYAFQQLEFVPASSSGTLEFVTTVTGDATFLIDAVNIVQRDAGEIVIKNPSFEASGSPTGVGYIQPASIAGWDAGGGGYGVNIIGQGPFTDNGTEVDQDRVLLLQNGGSHIGQHVSGFTVGSEYTLVYRVNARSCCGPENTSYQVLLGGTELISEDIRPVGGNKPFFQRFVYFNAESEEADLRFNHTSSAGDHTLLLDDVRIIPGHIDPPITLTVSVTQDSQLRISWRGDLPGYQLQTAPSVDGPWKDSAALVDVDGDQVFVLIDFTPANQFFRLVKP